MVIDTSAILALLLGEPDAPMYAHAFHRADHLSMAAPTWLECAMVITTRRGEEGYAILVDLLDGLDVEIVPFDATLAQLAFAAWLRYGKGRHPAGLNMGDCFSYALAIQRKEPLLFKGEDFSRTDVQRM